MPNILSAAGKTVPISGYNAMCLWFVLLDPEISYSRFSMYDKVLQMYSECAQTATQPWSSH